MEKAVVRRLRVDTVAPKIYKEGLIGGKGSGYDGCLTEGGFGGGGAYYLKNDNYYYGGGGGYTGGGTKIYNGSCDGGGGGSFAIDQEAQFDHVKIKSVYIVNEINEYQAYGKCTVTYLD